MMPTTLVLTFDQALDPTTAQDKHNDRIIGPQGRVIGVKSAVYDPATWTVTLHPRKRIDIHYRYQLIVDGAAAGDVTNTHGQLLDGKDDGHPGSNYRTPITWRNLVLDPPLSKTSNYPARRFPSRRAGTGGSVWGAIGRVKDARMGCSSA